MLRHQSLSGGVREKSDMDGFDRPHGFYGSFVVGREVRISV